MDSPGRSPSSPSPRYITENSAADDPAQSGQTLLLVCHSLHGRPGCPARATIQLSTNSFQNDRLPGKNEHRLGRIPGRGRRMRLKVRGGAEKSGAMIPAFPMCFAFSPSCRSLVPIVYVLVVRPSSLTWSILPPLNVGFCGIHFPSFAKAADKVHF